MASASEKLIVIAGPTASGKTDIAINLAQELNGSVVSADSRQVYAGMNIGTATPLRSESYAGQEPHDFLEPDVIKNVPHYLFNIRRPDEPLSLADWQAAAFSAIDQIHSAGSPAILVGGTMLYIDSVVKNYDVPQVPPDEEFRAAKEKEEAASLYAELLAKDPAAAEFVQPANKRRSIRALEVIAATGRPFSALRQQRPSRYSITMIGLFDSWEALAQRIEGRVAQMLADGLVEETRHLIDMYGADLPLLQTMNYQQTLVVISGELSVEEAQQDMIRANMRYARRQMSWWRGRRDITWYSPADREAIKKAASV